MGLLAGAYPAFVMSATSPVNALHRSFTASGTARVRQWLVVTQFSILIALLVATAVVHRQTTFALNEALRIFPDRVLLIFASKQTPSEAFKEALSRLPGVSGVTAAAAAPTNYDNNAAMFSHGAGAAPVLLQFAAVDFNFFEFYKLEPLAGRLPSRDYGTDLFAFQDPKHHASFWLNESAVRALGMKSPIAAIGQELKTAWPPVLTPPASIMIAGVMPDIPVDSVRGEIQPTAYFVGPEFARIVSVRLRNEQTPETLAAIDEVWKRLGEPRPISRLFLDHYYARMYNDIIQQRRVLGSLCGVAVFLACLGLFGLSIYTAQRRTREIGIRKVMGAGTGDIMRLLLWAFSKPVFWGSLVAWPVAAWAMNRWLEGFVYRVSFGWWLLPLASLLALVVALAVGAWRRIAWLRRTQARSPVVAASLGILVAWFVHTSVDWIHLLPGVTGIALIAAAVLLRPADPAAAPAAARPTLQLPRLARIAPAVAVGLAIAVAALSLSREGLSELYVTRAQNALA
ncbi:MAG: FtsX-like permease family protein, partial [Peristeroidobacter soli]